MAKPLDSLFCVENNRWKCKVSGCTHSFAIQKTGTTTIRWTHLEKAHPDEYALWSKLKTCTKRTKEPCNQQSIKKFCAQPKLDNATIDSYNHAVLQFIVEDGRPFETVAGSGFKNLCNTITKGAFTPQHPTTYARKLGDLTETLHASFVETTTTSMFSMPSITFDHFKADNGDNFLTLTCHFVSTSWQLESRCLAVINLENVNADHTAVQTKKIILDVFSKYNIDSANILCATTDTTPAMPATLKLMDIQWLGCAAHKLQLCITDAKKVQPSVVNLISKAHKIAGFFHSSTVGQTALTKHQKNLKCAETRPPMDVITRFNSTYYLLDWVLENSNAIELALTECSQNKNTFKPPPKGLFESDKETLKMVLPSLKAMTQATTMLSADQSVSISMVYPCIITLLQTLNELPNAGVSKFVHELKSQLKVRFDLTNILLLVGTFLDPRMKHGQFSSTEIKKVKDYIMNSAEDHKLSVDMIPDDHSQQTAPKSSSTETTLYDAIFNNFATKKVDKTMKSCKQQLEKEFAVYKEQPLCNRDSDPLQYWKHESQKLPLLSKLAADLLAVQATNISAERVNSVGSFVLADNRHSLTNTTAEKLIWSRANKKYLFKN